MDSLSGGRRIGRAVWQSGPSPLPCPV